MRSLVERLNQASLAYYNGEGERMTDYEWDAMFDQLKKLEEETGEILPNSPTNKVSEDQIAGQKEEHEFAALSLAKTKKVSDLVKWAQEVNRKLKKQGTNAPYAIIKAFNLSVITLGANIAGLLFIVNLIIIIVTIITMVSLLNDMKSRATIRMVIHDTMAAGMWAGFWLILISGLLALVPVIFNVDNIEFGFLLEIGSSVFLEYVIAGVIIYIICAIPWQITAAK